MEARWKQAIAEVWAMGDYPSIAPHLAAPATLLADRLGDGHGRRALDLGTGTGTAGIAQQRSRCLRRVPRRPQSAAARDPRRPGQATGRPLCDVPGGHVFREDCFG